MSDGINQTNNEQNENYDDFRFQDAARALFLKYQMMGMIKSSNEPAVDTSTTPIVLGEQKTTVRSRACTIL